MARFQSRLPASLYVAGPFAMGYTEFYNFLIPLYGLSLGMSAGQIGMLVGARSLLAVFLSIHVGALMDRLGTRQVALFFVWAAMALAPVFPLLPWFRPLLLLQVINGGALQFAWSGSQTLIAQLAEGEAEYLGRFSFFARIGTTVAPTIAGAAWDFGGAWPAYALGFAWGAALTLTLLRAPEAPIATGDGRNPGRRVRSHGHRRTRFYIGSFRRWRRLMMSPRNRPVRSGRAFSVGFSDGGDGHDLRATTSPLRKSKAPQSPDSCFPRAGADLDLYLYS
jgi:MFS family permease